MKTRAKGERLRRAFNKEVVRSIVQSVGRFAAIAIISLLGAGFYAGLRMAAPDMRIAGDEFFDATNMFDISVMTSLGLDEGVLEILRGVDGVGAVMPAYRADVMMRVGDGSYAALVESLPLSALTSDTSDGVHAISDDEGYLNRPILTRGAWPSAAGECVIGTDAAIERGIALGDTIALEFGNDDSEDVFAVDKLTVTGFVSSPSYISSNQLGVTSLGSGSIELYAYVLEQSFAEDSPYSVAYASVPSAADENWDSEGYDRAVAQVKERVEGVSGAIADERRAAVVADAQDELDDAREDYEHERADAESELSDAADELDKARNDLDEASSELASARSRLEESRAQLEESEGELREAEDEYAAGAAEVENQRSKLKEGLDRLPTLTKQREQLASQITQIEQAILEMRSNAQTLAKAQSEAQDQSAALEAALEQAKAHVAALEQAQSSALAGASDQAQPANQADSAAQSQASALAQAQAAQAELQAQADALSQALSDMRSQAATLESARTTLDGQLKAANEGLAQLDSGISEIEEGSVALDEAQEQLDASRAQLDEGWTQLEDGRRQYAQGWTEYENGLAEYERGRESYDAGRAEYDENKAKAADGFADAEDELAQSQADIDAIETPDVYVLDRTKNPGAASLSADAEGIGQIATFLPFMFFLVAALVALTSMTRMVDEERTEIGVHKALGYGKARVTSKYLVYGVLASGVGSAVGIVLLGKLLPWFILTSYAVTYDVPVFPTPLDPITTAKALGLSIEVTVLSTWAAAAASLRETPAALMLPRVPKAGKRIILERVRPLWNRLSFSHKVTARNLLRYKRRFFMAVFGIAGCTALLMIGFGLRDAIGGIVTNQFATLVSYDAAVRLDDDASRKERREALSALEDGEVESTLAVDDFAMIAVGPDDDLRIEVVVPSDPDALPDYMALRDRESGSPISLGDERIVITEKAASVLGLSSGEGMTLYEEDDVGDRTGEGRVFQVGGVVENYLGHYAYLLPETYETAFGEAPSYDLIYVKLADEADKAAFSDRLLSIDGVSTVSFVSDSIVTYEEMLDVMDKLILVIVLLSAALAFVVLYNLTNINITERVREIATLKVLGFTRSEVNAYIFREVMVMALIGAVVGCVIGAPLTFYIAEAAETANMMFGRVIEPASYVLSFIITMAFSVVVAFAMRRKLVRVDMVESLKSVE